ncbi:carboxymuconolactone decarboxylase family protein [Rhizobium sp. RCC_161_2]|uniref:carboxymuconolactone decarboxylase family protein n=1 Tax=Rhizobium sp. RCC_161_2 TaxID=3239219 RepID=UPI003525123B
MRLAYPDMDDLSPEQQRVYSTIAGGPRGRVRGPLALWLHRPQLAETAQALGQYCRYGCSLQPRLAEIAVLTLARIWNSELPWHAHREDALKAGVEADVIEAIRLGAMPDIKDAAGRSAYAVTVEICTTRRLSQGTYESALAAIGGDGLVDLIGLIGYYTLVAMTVNTFELPLPEGVPAAFPQ